jgi:hypothetical protein
MFDGLNGYAVGDPTPAGSYWVLKRTTNAGDTWFNAASLPGFGIEAGWNNSMMWFDSTYGWFGTNVNRIYRTTNGGRSWIGVNVSPVNTFSVWFNSLNLGLAGTNYRSTDTGATWNLVPNAPSGMVLGLSGLKSSQRFWATVGTNIFYSSNAGNLWTTSTPHGYIGTRELNHISIATVSGRPFGWAVGANGFIVYYATLTPGVHDGDENAPREFELLQNYPNPFNPSTTLSFSIPYSSFVILRVYDVLGREVATLVNEEKEPGRHTAVLDGKKLSSGVYICRLASGHFTQAMKMLLLR